MQYENNKHKIRTIFVKSDTSENDIIKKKEEQARLIKKMKSSSMGSMKKDNRYVSEWQIMDYSVTDKYFAFFEIPMYSIPAEKIPFISTIFIFEGAQSLIDSIQKFPDNNDAIKINSFFLLNNASIDDNIENKSYNLTLFAGIEIDDTWWEEVPPVYTELRVKLCIGFD